MRALARRPVKWPLPELFCCDLGVQSLPEEIMQGVDGVFHLAGVAHAHGLGEDMESLYWRVNVDSTASLLEAAANAGVNKFIYISSVKAVADPKNKCVDEGWDVPSMDAYGRSKQEAERLLLATGERYGMHVCILRPALVYGPGVKGNLRRMLLATNKGRFPPYIGIGEYAFNSFSG